MTTAKDSAELGAVGGAKAMKARRARLEEVAIMPGVDVDQDGPPADRWGPPDVECELNEAAQFVMDAQSASGDQAGQAVDFAPFVQLDLRAGLPPFPLDALPRWLAAWAEEAAEAEQVPLSMAAGVALGAMAIACAGKARVDMFGGEPLNLYLTLIDGSGANKSGIFARALRPVDDWEAARIGDFNARMDEWTAKVHEATAEVARIKGTIGKGRKGDDQTQRELDQGDARQRLEEAVKAQREVETARPRQDIRRAANITPEAMADHLSTARTVAQVSAEGAEVFDTMVRYQAGGKGAGKMEEVLKAWKGERLIVDRKNGTKIDVPTPTLTIVAAAQPDVLEKLRDPDGSREGRGLLGRFLYVVPVSKVGYRRLVRNKATVDAESAYRDGLRRLLDLAYPGEASAPMIALNDDAWNIASAFYDETEVKLRPGGELVDVASFTSKMRSHLARLAGLLHLADGHGVDEEIGKATMARALDLARYFLTHGRAAFGMMESDPESKAALRVWDIIRRLAEVDEATGLLSASPRRVQQIAPKSMRDGTRAALSTLERFGYLRHVDRKTEAGRTEKVLLLSPAAAPLPV